MSYTKSITVITVGHLRNIHMIAQIVADTEPHNMSWYSDQKIELSPDTLQKIDSESTERKSVTFCLSKSGAPASEMSRIDEFPSILGVLTTLKSILHGLDIRKGSTIFLWSDPAKNEILGLKILESGYSIDLYPSEKFNELTSSTEAKAQNNVYILHG